MKRNHNLATANGWLGCHGSILGLNGVRILEHTALRVARIIDLRNIANHLIDHGTLIGIVGHVGLQLEPFATRGLYGDSVDHDGGPFNGIVSQILNPLKLKSRIIHRRNGTRILQRRPYIG